MKRKLALFMVLAMLVSLVPMNVFAASSNTVVSAPSVTTDNTTTSTIRITEADALDWTAGATRTFELQLTNGEFTQGTNNVTPIKMVHSSGARAVTGSAGQANVVVKSDTLATVTMQAPTTATTGGTKLTFSLPLGYKATGGEVTVKIDPRDAQVTAGTLVIGNGVSGATNTTAASVKTFADTVTLDTIKIDETTIGTVATTTNTLEFKLPAGFEWTNTHIATAAAGGWDYSSATVAFTVDSTDKRIATARVDVLAGIKSTTQRGVLYITGMQVRRTSDAKLGDVTMNIRQTDGSSYTEQSVLVAKYASYDVTVAATGDPLNVYAGKYDGTATQVGNSDDNKLVRLKIKEEVVNSWLANRNTKIQFNDEVKILGFKIHKADNITGGSINNDSATAANFGTTGLDSWVASKTTNKNYIEISAATMSATLKANVELEFYVSVKPNYVGDITATVNGTALTKEYKVVLGKAVAPVAVTAVVKDLKLGLQNQAVGDIVITEPAKGVWGSKADGTMEIDVMFDDGSVNSKGTAKVTKGDVTIGNLSKSGATISIPVKYASTVASEITLSGVTIDLNRSIPEGKFEVAIGGDSIAQNHLAAETNGTFNKSSAASVLSFNIITPADANTKTISKVVFTIDAAEYKVGDTTVTSEAAPYINEQGRTMLPLRALANALNVSNDNIVWNDADRSVVIFKGESTVKVVIGEMKFTKNGTEVAMDTNAVIVNGRTMLPLRAIGQALGFTPVWDEATRTVTVQ